MRAADFYVAPTGSDTTGDGSLTNPWATIQHAVTATSHHAQADYGTPKNIWVRGGSYYNVTVGLCVWDSANFLIASYPGESAVLYGGQLLTNWSSAGSNGWFVARLGKFPNVDTFVGQQTNWQPRTLVADEVVVPRARCPEGKWFYTSFSGTSLVYTNDFPASTNGEVQADCSWNDTELAITAMNTDTKTITTSSSMSRAGQNADGVHSFRMLNTPEGMTLSEQFYWDKTNNAIVYKGTNPSTKQMIVPTVSRMFYIHGFAPDQYVSNITLSNLTIACVTAPINDGNKDDAGGFYYPAINYEYASNCAVLNCSIYGCAGQGIGNDNWVKVKNTTVSDCTIRDIGASGIAFPGGGLSCTISNNLIYNCGMLCQAGTGVRGYSKCKIVNNTITNITGAAIVVTSAGIGPGEKAYDVLIQNNNIVRAVKELRDMGAIYFWANTNCNVIGNYVRDVYSATTNYYNNDNAGWNVSIGIYSDMANDHPVVASNVVYDCTRPMMYHMSSNGVYQNNFFVNTRIEDSTIHFPNMVAPRFTNNIYVSAGTPYVEATTDSYVPFSVNANLAVQDWRGNIIWSTTGANSRNPTNATTADPLFTRITQRPIFRFLDGSPAVTLGISSCPASPSRPQAPYIPTSP